MISRLASDLSKAVTLLAAALICAGLANGLARPDRKLDWSGWAPPPATPQPAAPAPTPPQPPAAAPVPAAPAPPAPRKTPRPVAAALPTPPPPSADAQFAPSSGELIRDLASEPALDAFRRKLPFLDARRSADFEAGHVPGAWSVPIWEAVAAARITEFEARTNPSPQSPIVIYCAGGDCEDSRLLAKKLVGLGYRNLLIYRDGFPDWVKQGRPQEHGARP